MWKRFVSDYLNFTKKERTGILAVLFGIIVLIITPFLFPLFIRPKPTDASAFKKEIDMLVVKQADSTNRVYAKKGDDEDYENYRQPNDKDYSPRKGKGELFYFDPNTLNEEGWKRLGIRDKTIATIQNYVAKGGRFYKPEDIRKIWGLHAEDAERLLPFVQIKNSNQDNYFEKKLPETKTFEKSKYVATIIDINTADTSLFIALPGIGSKLSQRIISFRDKLGGFYTIEQVSETYGLPDSVFQKIKPRLSVSNASVNQININTATIDEMKTHPYLRYTIANAIVQYRLQHGNYIAVDDIKKIMVITDDIFNKAAPYLKVD